MREAFLPDLEEIKQVADHPKITRASRFVKLPELESAIDREQMFVAEVDGVVVGFLEGNPRTGKIWFIAVHPDYQGRGIGSMLVKEFSKGDAVTVNATVATMPFWRKLGFKQVNKPKGKGRKATVRMLKRGEAQKTLGGDKHG